jgi:TPR repeat protein
MKTINPPPPLPIRTISYPVLVFIFLIALAIGGFLQEARWRGAFTGLFQSPLETPAQQLNLAEIAFKNGNDAVALNFFKRLASQNDAVAQYWLAHMTELGLGAPRDIPTAISLYEKAAAQNIVAAQARLGEIYLDGNLVAPDYAKAFALLGKAARQGNPRSAMLLGQIYRFGPGTAADPIESYAWSEVAVVEGFSFAKIERDAAFTSLSSSDRDKGATRAAVILAEIPKRPAPSTTP